MKKLKPGKTKGEYLDFWLTTHGDRDRSDLFLEEKTNRFYVLMHDRNGVDEKIYIDFPKRYDNCQTEHKLLITAQKKLINGLK